MRINECNHSVIIIIMMIIIIFSDFLLSCFMSNGSSVRGEKALFPASVFPSAEPCECDNVMDPIKCVKCA